MTCPEARALFDRELDARLGAADAERLSRHLAHCGECRAEHERWAAASHALRAAGPTPIPADLAQRCFEAAMRARPAPTLAAWFVSAARPVAIAGAAAAAAAWLLAAATGPAPRQQRAGAQDPIEVALQLWTTEAGSDAP